MFNGTYHQIKYRDVQNGDPASLPVAGNRYNRTNQTNYGKIPGSPIAYWASQNLIDDFAKGIPLHTLASSKVGLQTGDVDRFTRQWHEVNNTSIEFNAHSIGESISSGKKWFPYNKGGAFRKWYGNYDYVVNWQHNGIEIRNFRNINGKLRSRPQNTSYYFRESITWSDVTSGILSFRLRSEGSIFDVVGMSFFPFQNSHQNYIIGFLNSKVADYAMKLMNPTIHASVGYMESLPIIFTNNGLISKHVEESIRICRSDWNFFENSWDLKIHPILDRIAEHTVLVICHIHRRISKIRVTAKHPFKKLATWWHKIQNVPKKCQTFGLGGH
jgi:hypothetical protein